MEDKWRDGLLHNSTGGVFKLIFIFLDALASLRSILFTESLIFSRNANVLLICTYQIFTNLLQMSTIPNVKMSVEICRNLLRSVEIFPDLLGSLQICPDKSRSNEICLIKSKYQSNFHNIKGV